MESKPSYGELEQQLAKLHEKLAKAEQKFQHTNNVMRRQIQVLEKSNTLFESVFEQAPFPIVLASAEGILMAMNSVCIERLNNPNLKVGMPLDAAKDLWKHFDENGEPIPYEQLPLIQALKNNVTLNKETRVVRDGQNECWEIISSSPIYDKDGKLFAGFLTFPDITERKKAEAKLLESEAHYRKLFENSGVSIWNEDLSQVYSSLQQLRGDGVTDIKQYLIENPNYVWQLVKSIKVIDVNDTTLRLFGVTDKNDFLQNISSSFGMDAIGVFTKEVIAIWERRSFFSSEANFLTVDGEPIKAIISFIIPEDESDFKSVPVSLQDISSIDHQKERLNAVVDALPDITFIFDEDGKYIEILTSRNELLYDELKNLKGSSVHDVLPKHQADFFVRSIRETLDVDHKLIVEYQLDVPHGKVWFEGRVSPMHNTFNNKKAVVWIAADITEHKKTETQLRQAQKMEAIGILTGGIAHEFNNLLSPILGYTELFLSDKSEDDPDFGGLEQIFIAGNRAKVLVQQLLAYGRQSMTQKEPIQLAQIIADAYKLISTTIPSNITINKNIQEDLHPIIGMANEIHQVILNLCVNANHSMSDGGELLITLNGQQPTRINEKESKRIKDSYICLRVADTGCGIDKNILERIFDPFFTTKDIGQGSGLGLSVVQGIVEQHNGIIEVESKKNVGTTFNIYFPITDEEIDIKEITRSPILSGNERILLIDDEDMIITITKNMLTRLSYKVTDILDANSALELFESNPNDFDLVITDYGMPKINGKQLAEKIKEIRADIPIILCTGYGDLITQGNISDWGMDDLLVKPFAYNELSETVWRVLSKVK